MPLLQFTYSGLGLDGKRDNVGNPRRVWVARNGVNERQSHFFYDNNYRLTRQQTYDSTGGVVYDNNYVYDQVGNRVQAYTPDSDYRLAYDDDNRLTEVWEYVDGEPSVQTAAFTYDADGNMTRRVEDGWTTTMGYDCLGEMLWCKIKDPSGTLVTSTSASYDAFGRQWGAVTEGVSWTRFVYDGSDRLAECRYSGAWNFDYCFTIRAMRFVTALPTWRCVRLAVGSDR